MTRSHIVAVLAAKAALGATLALGFATSPAVHAEHSSSSTTACLEDESCWDCSTMGNRRCG